jgi:hypothetical protein
MKRRIISAILTAGLAVGGVAIPAGAAFAKITPVDTACQNNGGQYPPGQQPSCTGGGLDQETENQNPAGHAPPGWNK